MVQIGCSSLALDLQIDDRGSKRLLEPLLAPENASARKVILKPPPQLQNAQKVLIALVADTQNARSVLLEQSLYPQNARNVALELAS